MPDVNEDGFFHLTHTFTKKWHHSTYPSISPLRPELSHAGKNIVITGGATGIGLAIAIAFAQASAASVSILGRREAKLQSAIKVINNACTDKITRTFYKSGDVADRAVMGKAIDEIAAQVGGQIHVVVSNAGQINALGPVAIADIDAVMRDFDTNVRGTLNVFQAFKPHAAIDAVFINTSSGVSHSSPTPGLASYAASKAASTKLVEYLGVENPAVRVHNVQPGVVATPLSETVVNEWDDDGEFLWITLDYER